MFYQVYSLNYINYIKIIQKERIQKKILLALSSIQPLIKSVERRERIINELKTILEDATTSRDKYSGQTVYQNIGELMLAMSDYLNSLHILASQAKTIERFEKFQQIKNE